MRAPLCICAVTLLSLSDAASQTPSLPPVASAVQKYLLDVDYPEQFGDTTYRVRVENLLIVDIDHDGQMEAIAHFVPHYLQSPTIVIYRIAADTTVTRVIEGLAPGPLQPITGEYLDSHTLGEAVDMDLADRQHDLVSRQKAVDAILGEFGSVVEYSNFFHVDNRKGSGTYVDMTGVSQPKSQTCEDFEFSKVDGISVGVVPSIGESVLLAAWVKDKVYLYRIKAFTSAGLIDKEMWTVDVAADFKGFPDGPTPKLEFLTPAGAAKPFDVKCDGGMCQQVGG